MILGTDKHEVVGGLVAFDLNGQIVPDKSVDSLDRPNNVAILTDMVLGKDTTDVAIVTERMTSKLRLFALPELEPLDDGGIPVFRDEPNHDAVMGIAVYKRSSDGESFVILSRKSAPSDSAYLHQYRLYADTSATSPKNSVLPVIRADFIRAFGNFSGKFEIEAIAVDQQTEYVYYSDEGYGIRKYYADPRKGNEELAVFGKDHFVEDREGIAIINTGSQSGYIAVSDQQGGQLHLYNRIVKQDSILPRDHNLLAEIDYQAIETDGVEVTTDSLNDSFPNGLLVAMSDDKTFQYYDMRDIFNNVIIR